MYAIDRSIETMQLINESVKISFWCRPDDVIRQKLISATRDAAGRAHAQQVYGELTQSERPGRYFEYNI